MCTAITFTTRDNYFGRTLDYERSFNESVTVTPRNFPFPFRRDDTIHSHYAMIGMATVVAGYPLYYDATNEKGLSMAGLYFPGNAVYLPEKAGYDNITPFEFIPWILGQCATVDDARNKLETLNLVDIAFGAEFPLTPLHWIIADGNASIVVEPHAQGLNIFDNPVGVMTNNPPFDFHMTNLVSYLNLTSSEPATRFAKDFQLTPYCRGMGAIGLPGDLSSASRFVRATFTKLNSVCGDSENESISQFFHILGTVNQTFGCVQVGDTYDKTIYTSCCNASRGIYYYTTYGNSQISAVDMHRTDLNSSELISYLLVKEQQIRMQN